MDVIFNSIYARAFMGAGLAVFSGIRAFLPIAFVALYSRLDFHSSPELEGTVFAIFEKTLPRLASAAPFLCLIVAQ